MALKILFVLPYVPSRVRVRPYHFIRELARHHEVIVLATGSDRELADAAELQTYCRAVHAVPLQLRSSLWSCLGAALHGEPLQAAYCRSWRLTAALREIVARQPFDLVHVEHLRAAHVRPFIPNTVPAVFDAVDCISLLLERTMRSSHSLRQRAIAALELSRTRAYEARLLRRYDSTLVTSPEDGRALQALAPGSEVTVVPNGVDLEYFRALAGPREPATLVFTGKMSYHANVTALLHFTRHIFPLVRQAHPDTRLRVVGSSPPEAVRALARDPAISVTGYLPDIREAMGRATVAVCPVTVKVGIQNKVLEAMAMGLPVVSTREGAEGLAVKLGRDLLVARDPAEFADHVCRLLADPNLRDRLGRAGRRYVEEQHRWDSAVDNLDALYWQTIERRAPFRARIYGNELPIIDPVAVHGGLGGNTGARRKG